MTTMRHLVIEQPGRLAWRECARPRLKTYADALVRLLIGARCASRGDSLGARFDIVVDACGDPAALPQTLSYAAPEAVFTSVTIYLDGPVPLPLREMYFKGITFRTGRPNVRPAMEHVLGLCRAGSFKPDAVPAKVFDFDDAVEAWSSEALRTAVVRRVLESG